MQTTVTAIVEKAKKVMVTKYEKQVVFLNRDEFPETGEPETLYMATDEHSIYAFENGNYAQYGGAIITESDLEKVINSVVEEMETKPLDGGTF